MSKKHYIKTASIISEAINKSRRDGWENKTVASAYRVAAETVGLDLADYFAEENPDFDRSKFLSACGIQ